MRTLQLIVLALLATAAKGQYYMELCGELNFGPCTVQPTMRAPTDAQIAGVDAWINSSFPTPTEVDFVGATDAGVIGWIGGNDVVVAWLDFFPEGSWFGESMSVTKGDAVDTEVFDMNDSGVAVGGYLEGGNETIPVMWFDGLGPLYGINGTVIPDPRLSLLGIDPATFNVDAGSYFTAINDQGDIAAQGPSFTYELLTEPIPEPSTLLLLATAGLALALARKPVLRQRSRRGNPATQN